MSKWKFICSESTGVEILIHDEASARNLLFLIKSLPTANHWWIQGPKLKAAKKHHEAAVSPAQAPQHSAKPEFAEARKAPRHAIELRVVIVWKGMSFRAFTVDISLGGFRLNRALPTEFMNQNCSVFIGSPTGPGNLELECRVLSFEGEPARVRFDGNTDEASKRLDTWIHEVIEAKKRDEKKAGGGPDLAA